MRGDAMNQLQGFRQEFIPVDEQRITITPSAWAVFGNGEFVREFASEFNAHAFQRAVIGKRFSRVEIREVYR